MQYTIKSRSRISRIEITVKLTNHSVLCYLPAEKKNSVLSKSKFRCLQKMTQRPIKNSSH